MGRRETASTVLTSSQPWLKYQHGWPQLWLARDQRLLSCQSRFPPSLLLPASCPHPPRWMLPRLALERSPPSWRRESWAPLPPSCEEGLRTVGPRLRRTRCCQQNRHHINCPIVCYVILQLEKCWHWNFLTFLAYSISLRVKY